MSKCIWKQERYLLRLDVWYLCAHCRPSSPSPSSSLMVEGMEGSKAFRSTTPSPPSPCSTPTLMLPSSPWRWNCTRRIPTPLKPRLWGCDVCFLWENKLLKMLKERRGSLICGRYRREKWLGEEEENVREKKIQQIRLISLKGSYRLTYIMYCPLMSIHNMSSAIN